MSRPPAEERIALLQARGEAQRLSAQLAVLETKQQLTPLRAAAGVVGLAAKSLSPGQPAGNAVSALAKFGVGRPWLMSALSSLALQLLRRHPLIFGLALAGGAVAWWLLRPPPGSEDRAGSDL
jgi:hypothetical protein